MSWVTHTPFPTNELNFTAGATDSTGQYLVSVVGASLTDPTAIGGIYISTNNGTSYSLATAPNAGWTGVATDSTGRYLVAVSSAGGIYTCDAGAAVSTTNYGVNWISRGYSNINFTDVASDATGQYLVASSNGNGVYISTNFGVNWTILSTIASTTADNWNAVAMSGSGATANIVIVGNNGTTRNVYTSVNMGTAVNQLTVTQTANALISVATDGTRIIVGTNGNGLYYTNTFAATVTNQVPTGQIPTTSIIYAVAISSGYAFALVYNGGLYSAVAGGNLGVFNALRPISPATANYLAIAVNPTNTRIVAFISGGGTTNGIVSYTGTTWNNGGSAGSVWVNIATFNTSALHFTSVATCNSNPAIMVATTFEQGIYYSTNGGSTWTQSTSAATGPNINWTSVSSNFDGSQFVASLYNATAASTTSGIYYSTDFGVTWVRYTSGTLVNTPLNYSSVSSDATGLKLIAAVNGGRIFYSSTVTLGNTTATWTQSNASILSWDTVASNSSGVNAIAIVNGGGLYYSSDSGATWTLSTSAPQTAAWNSVTSDATGRFVFASIAGGGIYYSNSGGSGSWVQTQAPIANWTGVATSVDGTLVVGTINGGGIYYSINNTSDYSSSTWLTTAAPSLNWASISVTSNYYGYVLAAVINGGVMYTLYSFKPNVPVCFVKGTPILVDQGIIPIESIDHNTHTINGNKIVAVTKTISIDDYLVCFYKHSLGINKPNRDTIMSRDHKIRYKGKMIEAEKFIGLQFENVKKVKYNGDTLYNILMEEASTINVNNLICETLDPNNIVAKLYTSNLNDFEKYLVVIKINEYSNTMKPAPVVETKPVNTRYRPKIHYNLK
jgi:hypothetical protein